MAKKPNPIDVTIGSNLRRIRLAQCMSQEELGGKCGITFQQIQKYEKGSNRIGGSRIVQICGVLNCRIADLFHNTM